MFCPGPDGRVAEGCRPGLSLGSSAWRETDFHGKDGVGRIPSGLFFPAGFPDSLLNFTLEGV